MFVAASILKIIGICKLYVHEDENVSVTPILSESVNVLLLRNRPTARMMFDAVTLK